MDASEIELVRASMRHLVTNYPPAELATQLLESGWGDLLATEAAVAIGLLAEEAGRSTTAGPMLDLVLQHGLGLQPDAATGVVLPPLARGGVETYAGRADGAVVVVNGLVLAGHERATRWLVATDAGVFSVEAGALAFRAAGAGDVALALRSVGGSATGSVLVASSEKWRSAVTLGRKAIAAELIGLAAQMLEDTVAYVNVRHQYGRPIGSFQTVKHRLADVHVATVAARVGLATAWSDSTDVSAMAALCLATRAQQLAATHCQQVHGGIAFTVEHGFHRFIRRGQLVGGLLGHPDDLLRTIGEALIERKSAPRTPQLTLAPR